MSTSTVPPIRWAVLGPGSIARRFVSQLPGCPGASLVSVGSSDPQRAARFAAEQVPDLSVSTGSYDDVLADRSVGAVYSLHRAHHPPAAGHRRPGGRQARALREAAGGQPRRRHDDGRGRPAHRPVCSWRPTCTRFHPQTAEGARAGGRRGRRRGDARRRLVRLPVRRALRAAVRPDYRRRRHPGRRWLPRLLRPGHRRRGRRTSGAGADGGHRQGFGGSDRGGRVGGRRPDLRRRPDRLRAHRGAVGPTRPRSRLYGSRGTLHLSDPWTLGTEQRIVVSTHRRRAGSSSSVATCRTRWRPRVWRGATAGDQPGTSVPQMSLADSLGNAAVLDTWREKIGLRYPFEADDSDLPTVSGRPLTVRDDALIAVRQDRRSRPAGLPAGDGLRQPADPGARLGGCSTTSSPRGGNAFDTGYIYGGGLQERACSAGGSPTVGSATRWRSWSRAPTPPHCDPESISRQPHRVAGPVGHRPRRSST